MSKSDNILYIWLVAVLMIGGFSFFLYAAIHSSNRQMAENTALCLEHSMTYELDDRTASCVDSNGLKYSLKFLRKTSGDSS